VCGQNPKIIQKLNQKRGRRRGELLKALRCFILGENMARVMKTVYFH
jgi:hypothetical protein